MTDVWYYHLERTTVEQTLPVLLEKTLAANQQAVVRCRSGARADSLCQHLWTYRENSWLPHGCAADGFDERQHIWVTEKAERPNKAAFLFLIDGQDWPISDEGAVATKATFDRVLDLFDGTDTDAVAAARDRWKADRAAGFQLSYWQQSPDGIWSQSA